jgi:hypothetical protein
MKTIKVLKAAEISSKATSAKDFFWPQKLRKLFGGIPNSLVILYPSHIPMATPMPCDNNSCYATFEPYDWHVYDTQSSVRPVTFPIPPALHTLLSLTPGNLNAFSLEHTAKSLKFKP